MFIDVDVTSVDTSSFFWCHAYNLANSHGVALSDLILVDKKRYSWEAQVLEPCGGQVGHDMRGPLGGNNPHDIYFHRLPPTEDGELPTPFGYWSFDPDPTPGPWPEIPSPGIQLSSRTDVSHTYLSEFQAELVTCFNRGL
ncbi:hypothetical protein OBBRIDRAFT_797087, partial [Obba rivulosa]